MIYKIIIAKASISALLLVALLAGSALHAWEATESNKEIAVTIESSFQTKAMLEICGENELAEALNSALILLTNHYVEINDLSQEDRNEMLGFFQADVDYVFSRLEMSLNEQECDRLIESAELRISSYIEIATHNN